MDKKDDTQKIEGKGVRVLKRRSRQEALSINIESFEEIKSMKQPKV